MDQETIEAISSATAEAVLKTMGNRSCCSAHCSERCGFPPTEHAKKHQRADEFLGKVDQAEKVVRSTAVKAVIGAMILFLGSGFLYTIYQWFEKIKLLK